MKSKRLAAVAAVLACLTVGCSSAPSEPPPADPVPEPLPPAVEDNVPLTCVDSADLTPATVLWSLGTFRVTHYCPCEKCNGKWAGGITATGVMAQEGRTVAVDPAVIPYGTEVRVRYEDGTEHTYIAEDCGGAINGNELDVFMDSHEAAWAAGVKSAEVFIKEGETWQRAK